MSYFPDSPIVHITCELLTDQGLKTFVVADSFDDSLFIRSPSFGSEKGGVKCRIRTDSASYKSGDGVVLFWEIINTKQKSLMLTNKKGWTVEVDGKKVDMLSGEDKSWGWATQRGPYRPQQFLIKMDSSKLSIGEHTVQISYKGKGGSYKNVDGKWIPGFKGTLKSNCWTFTIGHK